MSDAQQQTAMSNERQAQRRKIPFGWGPVRPIAREASTQQSKVTLCEAGAGDQIMTLEIDHKGFRYLRNTTINATSERYGFWRREPRKFTLLD
jgi:hypothetical protein